MLRDIFSADHELFRNQFRRNAKAEAEPKIAEWNARGQSDRESWRKIAAQSGAISLCVVMF